MMDLLKENAENRFVSNGRNIKGNLAALKQIKQSVKPLSDVKNILSESNCISQKKSQNKSCAEPVKKVEEVDEYGYDDLCFYSDSIEDDYGDIIGPEMELTPDHLNSLACVFDRRELLANHLQPELPLLLELPPFIIDHSTSFHLAPFEIDEPSFSLTYIENLSNY